MSTFHEEAAAAHNIDHNPVCRYDYENQAWVKDGLYIRCGHPDSTVCGCFGRTHEGEPAN